jgi:hypothetical protein
VDGPLAVACCVCTRKCVRQLRGVSGKLGTQLSYHPEPFASLQGKLRAGAAGRALDVALHSHERPRSEARCFAPLSMTVGAGASAEARARCFAPLSMAGGLLSLTERRRFAPARRESPRLQDFLDAPSSRVS